MKSGVKEKMIAFSQQLPEDCTWDDVMYRIYVLQKIEAGLQDVEAGRTTSHDAVFDEFRDDSDPVD